MGQPEQEERQKEALGVRHTRNEILESIAPVMTEEIFENAAAFACGATGSTGWLCSDLIEAGQTTLAMQVAKFGDEEGDLAARYYLGILFQAMGELYSAIDAFKSAIPLEQAAWRWGDVLRTLGDSSGAAQVFEEYAASDAECAVEYSQLTDSDPEKARSLLRAHLKAGVLDVLIPLAEVAKRLGKDADALTYLRIAVLSGEPNAAWNYALALEEAGDADSATWLRYAAQHGDDLAVARADEYFGEQWRNAAKAEPITDLRHLVYRLGEIHDL